MREVLKVLGSKIVAVAHSGFTVGRVYIYAVYDEWVNLGICGWGCALTVHGGIVDGQVIRLCMRPITITDHYRI